MKCPDCGDENCYIGLNVIECSNIECECYEPDNHPVEKVTFDQLKSAFETYMSMLSKKLKEMVDKGLI